ncbi:MAG: SCP2 sterol-binding domain-containing protein [Gammaproteobacteria bacterium]|nr:SCP2 sterol-binding domain-containing protein [Gammaproteobacteria bacterium]
MLLKLINNALQKYLDSDPEIAAKLNKFEGQRLLVHLTDIEKEFLLTPVNSSVVVSEHVADEDASEGSELNITTTIHSNIISLARMGLGAEYKSMLNSGSLKIEGDVEFANQLRSIFIQVDIDWEEIASKYVGDAVAYQIGLIVNKFKNYKKRSIENFRLDVSEYLQEESRILPTKVELDRFMSGVDSLDANVQRLEARIQRLMSMSELSKQE